MIDDAAIEAAAKEGLRLYAVGQAHRDRDEWPEALAAFRAALDCEEQVPDDQRRWGNYGMTLHELAVALMALGDREGALGLATRTSRTARRSVRHARAA